MDLNAIQAAISSLKAATDISKSFLKMKTTAEIQGKVSELQGALLEAQNNALTATAAQFELQDKVRELEAQLKSMSDWESQKARYDLVAPWQGPAQVYALKRSHAEGEAPHLLCSNCFQNRKRSILNPKKEGNGWIAMTCPTCKATLDTGYRGIGAPSYAEDYVQPG